MGAAASARADLLNLMAEWGLTTGKGSREIADRIMNQHARELSGPASPETHEYLSTGCLHGEHGYCQADTGAAGRKVPARCKFCAAPCICTCHQDGEQR